MEASALDRTAEDLRELDEPSPPGMAGGNRYPAPMMGVINGDWSLSVRA